MHAMNFKREISVSPIKPISTPDLTEFLHRVQPSMDAQIFDIGGTTAFWKTLDRQVHPLSITLINLPGLVDLQESEPGIQVINGSLANLKTLVADRATDQAIDIVVCRGVLEHIEDRQQQRSLTKLLRNAGQGYWVQTAQRPGLLNRLWSGSSDLALEETEETKPGWIESLPGAATLDRQGLARLFPDATRIVAMRQLWRETSYAAYRTC
jgi:phospholipid N-methyltransferase